jgi:hypothetical protein
MHVAATSETTKPTRTASVSVSGNNALGNVSPVAITFGPPTVIGDTVDVTDAFDAVQLARGRRHRPHARRPRPERRQAT